MRISTVCLFSLACFLVSMGCESREPAESGRLPSTDSSRSSRSSRSDTKHGAAIESAGTEPTGPTPEQAQAIATIAEAGGRVDCDARGLPVRIDLASHRVFANEQVVRAVLEFPELERLRLAVSGVDPTILARLATLSELNELMLQDAASTDDELAGLVGSLKHLERLTLRRLSHVTDRGIEAVTHASHIEVLALIEMNQVTGTALEDLQRMERLRSLDLRHCGQLAGADFLKLQVLPSLSELKLAGSAIDDQVMHTVAQLPALSALTVEDARITQDGLSTLAASAKLADRLRSLSLARCFGVTDEALVVLAQFPNLQTLSLRDIVLTGSFLNNLGESGADVLPWTTLMVNDAFLTDETVAMLPRMAPRLKRLDLRRNPGITERSRAVLKQLKSLEQLQLDAPDATAP